MKNTLFSAKSPLLKPFIWAADILILSVLWTLCSILVVTAGAASTAAYDCAAHCMIGGEGELIRRFFRTFKRELKQSCLSVVLWTFFFYPKTLNPKDLLWTVRHADSMRRSLKKRVRRWKTLPVHSVRKK